MTQQLQTLFKAIANSHSELELQQTVINKIGTYFTATRQRLFLLDRLSPMVKNSQMWQLALSIESNPILRYLVENHIPVHEGIILTAKKWQKICPRFDHGHVMAGPIVENGRLIGGLAFTREVNTLAFNHQNLLDLSALCLHISTQLIKINSQPKSLVRLVNEERAAEHQKCDHIKIKITKRELQIAELIAQGLTNKQIGKVLWITENSVKQALKRMFRKLGVSSRAEMIAVLSHQYDLQSNNKIQV